MNKTVIKTVIAAFASLVLFFGLLELGMRTLGRGILAEQESRNEIRPADEHSFRIVTIGESTTADYFSTPIHQLQHAWPRQLEYQLAELGVGARVYNLARPATTSTAILERLPEQLDRYRPGLVISMMGVNDSGSLLARRSSWWSGFRVVKIYRLIRQRIHRPPEYVPRNFTDLKTTEEIILGLRSKDPASALAKADLQAASLEAIERAQFYLYLAGRVNETEGKRGMQQTIELFKRSLNSAFQGGIILMAVSDFLAHVKRDGECLELAREFVRHDWFADEAILFHFSRCEQVSRERNPALLAEWRGVLKKMRDEVDLGEGPSGEALTAQNYRALHRLLAERNIRHVAMQYPTRPLAWLENYFKKAESGPIEPEFREIIFAENRKNFETALKKHGYDKIFTDRFGGTFGHTTDLGHELLARTAAEAVRRAVGPARR